MRCNLATLLTITTVGPPVLACSYGEWWLPSELAWIAYSLLPPLVVAVILGIWARVVFWSITHVEELNRMRMEAVSAKWRIVAELSGRVAPFGGAIWRILDEIFCRVRGVIPAFRFLIRDVLWLMLVVALLTQWWIERSLLQERVANLEHSDAAIRTIKQSLCMDDKGFEAYLTAIKKLPKVPTNFRVGPIQPIVNGSPRALSQIVSPVQASAGQIGRP